MDGVDADGDFFGGAKECANSHAVLEGEMDAKVTVVDAGVVQVGEAYAYFEIGKYGAAAVESVAHDGGDGINIDGAVEGFVHGEV